LIAKKGILTTLEAMDGVGAVFPDARYILCGSGPMMDEIQKYVKDHALERHVEIRGWMSQEALREELYQAHVFLHPSEQTQEHDQEGIPNSMLEAMATGLPVVATQHGGIPEAVTDGYDGLLVPERNAHQLSTAITRLIQDHALHAELGRNAAISVRAHFGAEQQISLLEDHYLEAIASAKASAEVA
jgi:glycosyltransferase involved in cell wall biosynthesis